MSLIIESEKVNFKILSLGQIFSPLKNIQLLVLYVLTSKLYFFSQVSSQDFRSLSFL